MPPDHRTRLWSVITLVLAPLTPLPAAAAAIVVTTQNDLGFGGIVASGSSGSVTISPVGVRSAAGGVALGSSSGASPAVFRVEGDPSVSFGIVVPASATLTSASGSMAVDGFTTAPSGSGTLGADGRAEVRLGATLHVGAGQANGAYSGPFDLTVAYE